MSKTYETLDAAIIRAIESSNGNPTYNRAVAAEGLRIAESSGRDDMRVIDGRLQALRKAGKIRFLNKAEAPGGKHGWYVGANG